MAGGKAAGCGGRCSQISTIAAFVHSMFLGCSENGDRDPSEIDTDGIAVESVDDLAKAGFEDNMLKGHSLAGAIIPRMAALQLDCFSRLVHLAYSAPLNGVSFLQQIGAGTQGRIQTKWGGVRSCDDRASEPLSNDVLQQQE